MTRVFLDANVIVAASKKSEGAASIFIRLASRSASIKALASGLTVDEAERIIQRFYPEALPEFDKVKEHLTYCIEPSEDFVARLNSYLPPDKALPDKDLPVLGGAIAASADWFVTLDDTHFGPLYGQIVENVEIMPLKEALKRLRSRKKD